MTNSNKKHRNYIERDIYNEETSEEFINKHNDSFITGYLINESKMKKKLVSDDMKVTIMGYCMLLSIIINIYQGTLPTHEYVKASYSNSNGTIMKMTTLPVAVNTVPLVLAWANNSIASAFTLSFSTYNHDVEASRYLFTPAGYAGFLEALDKSVKENIMKNRMDITTIPSGQAVMKHMYSQKEPWYTIQMPIIINYSVGINSKDISQNHLLSINIIPVDGSKNPNGKAIDSISISTI